MFDWARLTLFFYILMRMSGFVLFNPLFGRRGIPGIVRSGFILVLSVSVISFTEGTAPVPATLLEFAVRLFLELVLGYLLGLVMNLFFSIPATAGHVIDTQMGMSLATTYDAGAQSSVSVTSTLLNVLMVLLFFSANGHHTLLRILLTSGEVVPYGGVAIGNTAVNALAELFIETMLMAVKLAMPVLAAEFLGEVGMGILMKTIPQINVFAINMELKVIIGLVLVLILITPFSEFLLDAELNMLSELRRMLTLVGAVT